MDEKKYFEDLPKSGSDPSNLTTQLVLREIGSLKELVFSEIQGMKEAIKVAHNDLVRVPTDVEKAVSNLQSLHEEKFKSIDCRFSDEANLRNEKFAGMQKEMNMQEKLSTQQYNFLVESINKSDAAFIKLNENMALLITVNKTSTDDKINDVKDGVGEIKTIVTGFLSSGTGRHEQIKSIGANVGTIISIVTLIIVLISFAFKFSGKTL